MIATLDLPSLSTFLLVSFFTLVFVIIPILKRSGKKNSEYLRRMKSNERAKLLHENLKAYEDHGEMHDRFIANAIAEFRFPQHAIDKVANKHNLDSEEMEMVVDGLKEYLILSKLAEGKSLAMPSLVVDDLWHEFILCTKAYREFCDMAFGYYLDHNPSVSSDNSDGDADALARVWDTSCILNGNRLRTAKNASILFTVDYNLGITPINHALTMLDTMGMLDVAKENDNKVSHSSDSFSHTQTTGLLSMNAAGCKGDSHTNKESSGKNDVDSDSSSSSSSSKSASSCSSKSSCSSCSSCGGGGGD